MNQENNKNDIFKEFWIANYGGNLVISATDKAYELLGLNEKTKILKNGKKVDSIDNYYYIVAFLRFLKNNYNINGLIRESKGNSHDSSYEKEIYVFNDGGIFKEEFDKYRTQNSSLYEEKPMVISENALSDNLIEEWAKKYDLSGNGEGKRLIFCSYNDNSDKFIYEFGHTYLYGTADDKIYKNESNDFVLCPIYLKKI